MSLLLIEPPVLMDRQTDDQEPPLRLEYDESIKTAPRIRAIHVGLNNISSIAPNLATSVSLTLVCVGRSQREIANSVGFALSNRYHT